MAMTDPVADMLTRVRNALGARHKTVDIPASKLKGEIARILKEEGYIIDFSIDKKKIPCSIRIRLKYEGLHTSIITEIKRISKPGKRVYVPSTEIPKVMNGIGIAILSTSKGVLADRKARELGVGGELLCSIY
jgi:small subunit ribosomal protein S8